MGAYRIAVSSHFLAASLVSCDEPGRNPAVFHSLLFAQHQFIYKPNIFIRYLPENLHNFPDLRRIMKALSKNSNRIILKKASILSRCLKNSWYSPEMIPCIYPFPSPSSRDSLYAELFFAQRNSVMRCAVKDLSIIVSPLFGEI